jgi:hypothetical protein
MLRGMLALGMLLFLIGSVTIAQEPLTGFPASSDPGLPSVPEPVTLPTVNLEPTAVEQDRQPKSRSPMGRRGMGGPGGAGRAPGYTVEVYPGRPVSSRHSDDLYLLRQNLNVGYPILKTESDMMLLSLGVGYTHADGPLMPESKTPFPRDLWNLQTGLNYFHTFDNGWMGGLILGVGSPSDQPFQSINEVAVNLGTFLRVPAKRHGDAWQFSLFYSTAGQVNFPLPGIAYNWNPSEKLSIGIGLPFTVHWEPNERWELDISYVPLLNINAQLQYKISDRLRLHGGYQFQNETYFLAGRLDRRERFFLLEQRVLGGVRYNVFDRVSVDCYSGLGFDRRAGSGFSPWEQLRDGQRFSSFPFFGLNASLQF